MVVIRSLLFNLGVALCTLVMTACLPYLMIRRDSARVRRFSRAWSGFLRAWLRLTIGLSDREVHAERKPAGPALYVCNHQSVWETLFFNLLIPDVAIVLKEELLSIPVFGWFLRNSPMIPLNRHAGASAMRNLIRDARKAISEGRSVLIFPEGTRRGAYSDADFKVGAAALYSALGVPIVPVALTSGLFWENGSFLKYGGTIDVSYLEPIAPAGRAQDVLKDAQKKIYQERDRLVKDHDIDIWALACG